MFHVTLLTAAELVRLVPTVVVIVAGVLDGDALSVTAFVLFLCTGPVCGALAWTESQQQVEVRWSLRNK